MLIMSRRYRNSFVKRVPELDSPEPLAVQFRFMLDHWVPVAA
jgi:hypothetical protein